MRNLVGRQLGAYQLDELLGSGAMGSVYRAHHRDLRRPSAIKVLHPHLAVDEGFVRRFKLEAEVAAGLDHPNIVRIYDVGRTRHTHYIAMQLVEGTALDIILRDGHVPQLDRALHLLDQIAGALDYAHRREVVHRDLKPANLILGPDDRVTVVDFGLARAADWARLTRASEFFGTPEYAAPELILAGESGPSVDLYALGLIAHELLTGHSPFGDLGTLHILNAHLNQPPPPLRTFRPDLPPALETALARQLGKDPAERFPTAGDFVAALRVSASRSEPVGSAPDPKPAPDDFSASTAGIPAGTIPPAGRFIPPPGTPASPDSSSESPPRRKRTVARATRVALETDLLAGAVGSGAFLTLLFVLSFHPAISLALASGAFLGAKLALPDLNPDRPVADDLTARELRTLTGRWRDQTEALRHSAAEPGRSAIRDRLVSAAATAERILAELERAPAKIRATRFALTLLLDAAAELSDRYARLAAQGTEALRPTLAHIDENLQLICTSLERLLANLHQTEIADLEAFIQVLQQTLRLEGIWESQPAPHNTRNADAAEPGQSERS